MSANIEVRTLENGEKKESFVSTQPEWHGLGRVYDAPLTAKEALENCGANFEVQKQSVLASTPQLDSLLSGEVDLDTSISKVIDGRHFVDIAELRKMIVDGYKATMRTDYNEVLGMVSDQYGVVQNSDAFAFIDTLCSGKLGGETPMIEAAGVLGHGERIFITAKFPEPIRLLNNDNDIINQYIVATTSHDGMGAVNVLATNIRVVCQNTLNWAMHNNSGKLSFKHTRFVGNRMDLLNKENAEHAYSVLGMQEAYRKSFEESLSQLASIKMSDKDMEKAIVKSVLNDNVWKVYKANDFNLNNEDISTRSRNIVENIKDACVSGVGQNIVEGGTGLWLVNGLTTFYQNNVDWKDNEKKFNAMIGGSVQTKLQNLYNNVISLAA